MKDFIDLLHDIREEISEETKDMSAEQRTEYENKTLEEYLEKTGRQDRMIHKEECELSVSGR